MREVFRWVRLIVHNNVRDSLHDDDFNFQARVGTGVVMDLKDYL